jgi:hypothetical protein
LLRWSSSTIFFPWLNFFPGHTPLDVRRVHCHAQKAVAALSPDIVPYIADKSIDFSVPWLNNFYMSELSKIVAVSLGVAGVIAAASVLKTRVKSVEEKGLTLTTGALLVIAGYTLYTRFEDTAEDLKQLRT